MLGLDDIFWISALLFILIVPIIWITRPGRDGNAAAAGAGGH
jgi:DHA2 family multidrug resistance protein